MKKLFLLLVLSLFVFSCDKAKEGKTEETKIPKKIIKGLNDEIQDTFFGVKYGASQDEVIEAFAKENFYPSEFKTDIRLQFFKRDGKYGMKQKYFSFGNMEWECIGVHFRNNSFCGIEFLREIDDKEKALTEFDMVLSTVSSKYKMIESNESNIPGVKMYFGFTKENILVGVLLDENEGLVGLMYADRNLSSLTNDEL